MFRLHQKNSQASTVGAAPLLKNVRPEKHSIKGFGVRINNVRNIAVIKPFFKYHGAGNDFIIIDDRNADSALTESVRVAHWCDRHFGVGADGLMLLRNSEVADFEMLYFNADGNPGSMCGNGGRCIVRFATDIGLVSDKTTFMAVDGLHRAEILSDQVRLEMTDVHYMEPLDDHTAFLDTGSPHVVKLVPSLEIEDFVSEARKVRYAPRFMEKGVNVNFITESDEGVAIRTYERGVENETLACGTGVTAAALAMHHWGKAGNEVVVSAVGGKLRVSFEPAGKGYRNIWKAGPAKFVFKGEAVL